MGEGDWLTDWLTDWRIDDPTRRMGSSKCKKIKLKYIWKRQAVKYLINCSRLKLKANEFALPTAPVSWSLDRGTRTRKSKVATACQKTIVVERLIAKVLSTRKAGHINDS